MIIGCKNLKIASRRRIRAAIRMSGRNRHRRSLVPHRQRVRSSNPMGRFRRRRCRISHHQLGRNLRHGRRRRPCRRLLCRNPDRVQPRADPLQLHRATPPRRLHGASIRSIRVRILGSRQELGILRRRPLSSPSRRPLGHPRTLRRPVFHMLKQVSVQPSNNHTLLRQRTRSGCRRGRRNFGRKVHRLRACRQWICRG